MTLSKLGYTVACLLAMLGWLVPNHYPPWTSFHNDVLITSAFFLALLVTTINALWRRTRSPHCGVVYALLTLSLVPISQYVGREIVFFGDALMAFLYVSGFGLSVWLGLQLGQRYGEKRVLSVSAVCLIAVAVLNVVLQLYQFCGLQGLQLFVSDLPPGARPFGNLAQPNQLATLLLLALGASCVLYEAGVVGRVTLYMLSSVLLLGLALAQSRSSLLAYAVGVLWIATFKRKCDLRLDVQDFWMMTTVLGLLVLFVLPMTQWLGIGSERELTERLSSGTRPTHWATMLDAIGRSPWFGYGWNQVSLAQASAVTDHPFSGEMIEHSHNLVLDLLVWNGIPLGSLLVAAIGWWCWTRLKACGEVQTAICLAMIGVVLVHAMLEFPLDYAYFLLPTGLLVGLVECARARKYLPRPSTSLLPLGITSVCAVLVLALTICVVVEYVRIEADYRLARFSAAKIGTTEPRQLEPPVLLTQLGCLLWTATIKLTPNMAPDDVVQLLTVSRRFGFATVLMKSALASAMNGDPATAQHTLLRLTKTQVPSVVDGARLEWNRRASQETPALAQVAFPASETAVGHRPVKTDEDQRRP